MSTVHLRGAAGPEELLRMAGIATRFCKHHRRSARGHGIRNCVIYTQTSGETYEAHWTKSGAITVTNVIKENQIR